MHHTHVGGLSLVVCEGEHQAADATGEHGEILVVQTDCGLDVVAMLPEVLGPELIKLLEELHLHRDTRRRPEVHWDTIGLIQIERQPIERTDRLC